MKKKMKEIKVIKNNSVGLIIEAVLLFLLLYFLIMSFMFKEFYVLVEYVIAFLLLDLSYNNFYLNKRSKIGITYLICGIIILITTTIGYVR